MAISNKMANEQLREGYLNALTAYLEKEEQVLRVKSNEIAVPVVDANGDEKFIVITVKVPTGADKGREPYDGYAEAEDYAHKLREKAIKAEKKKAEKEKKIAHDEKMRAKNKQTIEQKKGHAQGHVLFLSSSGLLYKLYVNRARAIDGKIFFKKGLTFLFKRDIILL